VPRERRRGSQCKKFPTIHVSSYAQVPRRSPSLPLHEG
jgi:hypothetical protein